MSEIKKLSPLDVLRLAREAAQHGFNRQLDTEQLLRELDPEGVNVLEQLVPHFHIAGVEAPMHFRCFIYVKVRDSLLPVKAQIDVTPQTWDSLPDIDPGLVKAAKSKLS